MQINFSRHKEMHVINTDLFVAVIAIHSQNDAAPSFGATRFVKFTGVRNCINDALGLARFMTYKSAMAGLPYGGAKGVLALKEQGEQCRQEAFKRYIQAVNDLQGRFVTGADMGVELHDVQAWASVSPHVVGVRVDPVDWTAEAIVAAIRFGALKIFASASLVGKRVLIQGFGKTGSAIYSKIKDECLHIDILDPYIPKQSFNVVKSPNTNFVNEESLINRTYDIVIPCAGSRTVSCQFAARLNCRLICGPANQQLKRMSDARAMHQQGILYLPDFLVNVGGLLAVTAEFENQPVTRAQKMLAVSSIQANLADVFDQAFSMNIDMNTIAMQRVHNALCPHRRAAA